ncbi:hypothetical protein R5R35_009528 [Gryllus longicercus]|uniref:Uncharacterized protein n=1 Tax=Gryllus longicercus TaxID=2509291 RepID=A0AAN9VG70_9ORTH
MEAGSEGPGTEATGSTGTSTPSPGTEATGTEGTSTRGPGTEATGTEAIRMTGWATATSGVKRPARPRTSRVARGAWPLLCVALVLFVVIVVHAISHKSPSLL